jgi:hypothetical protein
VSPEFRLFSYLSFLYLRNNYAKRLNVKAVKDILRSPSFMREVSILLFGFAALSGLFSLLLLTSSSSDSDVLASAIGGMMQAMLYVVLAIMIRRGSVKALWAAGILFTFDTLLWFFQSSGKGLGAMIVGRGILIYVLVRYILRQRALT